SLKCARITLHMNLFTSFAANNSLWLIWYLIVMPDYQLLQQGPPTCVALHVILHYFLLTNYSWMLCEGFYLHTVLVSAFISEKKLVKWLIACRLGFTSCCPFLFMAWHVANGFGECYETRHFIIGAVAGSTVHCNALSSRAQSSMGAYL
ncbi:hypothetical protein DOY81_012932, partial [Sarcophaga bullata]